MQVKEPALPAQLPAVEVQQSASVAQVAPAAPQVGHVSPAGQVPVQQAVPVAVQACPVAMQAGAAVVVVVEGAQVPPNKFRIPKSHVNPPNCIGCRRLLHVPDMQSVPLSTGKHNSPAANFVRQQPTPKPMVLVTAQYSVVLLHPLFTSVQRGSQKGRSSASAEWERTRGISAAPSDYCCNLNVTNRI